MHWQRRLLIIVAAALGVGVLAFDFKVIQATQGRPASAPAAVSATARLDAPAVTYVDPSTGPQDAKHTIVEFGDYLCGACQSSHLAIDQLLQNLPNDVRYVWKNDPSPLHPGADIAAEASMCAAKQGAFWDYHRKLFDDQQMYNQVSLTVTADNLGLDATAFGQCMANHAALPLVERTVAEGRALGIEALPTLFIDGQRHEGAMTYDQLLQAISR